MNISQESNCLKYLKQLSRMYVWGGVFYWNQCMKSEFLNCAEEWRKVVFYQSVPIIFRRSLRWIIYEREMLNGMPKSWRMNLGNKCEIFHTKEKCESKAAKNAKVRDCLSIFNVVGKY